MHLSYGSGERRASAGSAGAYETWRAGKNRPDTVEAVREYLVTLGYYPPYVETITAHDVVEGKLIVYGAALTKMRLVFPLFSPVQLSAVELATLHKLIGSLFGVTVDASVSNKLSQPLFFPRRPKGAEYKFQAFKRPLLDAQRALAFADENGIKVDAVDALGLERKHSKSFTPQTVQAMRTLSEGKLHAETMKAAVHKFQHALEAADLILACGDESTPAPADKDKPSLASLSLQAAEKVTGGGVRFVISRCPMWHDHSNAEDADEQPGGKNKPVAWINASESKWHMAGAACFHTCHAEKGLLDFLEPVLAFLELEDLRPFVLPHAVDEFDAYVARVPRTLGYIAKRVESLTTASTLDEVEAVLNLIAQHHGLMGEETVLRSIAQAVTSGTTPAEHGAATNQRFKELKARVRTLRQGVKDQDAAEKREAGRKVAEGANIALAEMNERYCVVPVSSKTLIIKTPPPPRPLQPQNRKDLIEVKHANDGGEFLMWLTHPQRREYDGWQFRPAKPLEFVEDGLSYINRFRGFACEAVSAVDSGADYALFRQHILQNVCSGDARLAYWLWNWLLHMFQCPEELPGTFLVMFSSENGTGKSLFATVIRTLWGKAGGKVSRQADITGSFNTVLADKVVVQAEEIGTVFEPAARGILKDQATAETISIHRKFQDVEEDVPNFARMMFSSNHLHAAFVEHGERRAAVTRVAPNRVQDRNWFGKLVSELELGGREALLYDMLNRPMSKFVNPCKVPQTIHLIGQKQYSMDAIELFILDMLENGTIELEGGIEVELWAKDAKGEAATPYITTKAMKGAGLAFSKRERAGNHFKAHGLAEALKRYGFEQPEGPCPVRDPKRVIGWESKREARPRAWKIPTLEEARQAFANHWQMDVTGAKADTSAIAGSGAVAYNLPTDELKAFVAFMLSIPVEDVTEDMLRPSQLVGSDAGPLSPINRDEAEDVEDVEAARAEEAAVERVETLYDVPDIDDAA